MYYKHVLRDYKALISPSLLIEGSVALEEVTYANDLFIRLFSTVTLNNEPQLLWRVILSEVNSFIEIQPGRLFCFVFLNGLQHIKKFVPVNFIEKKTVFPTELS